MSGATWVLLRGLTRERRHWGEFPTLFGERVGAARVIALDLPGNGARHQLPSPAHVDAMAAACRADLQRRSVAPPYHLLAMSLGAMVACAWGFAHPAELAGAVLINTSLRPFSPFTQRLRPRNYARLARLLLTHPSAREWEQAVLQLTSNAVERSPSEADALIDTWAAYRRESPVSTANALRQLIAATRFRAPAAPPATPLLVCASARDALVDPRCSMRLAAGWRCPIATHPWAGHDLPLDDGPWVAAQVAEWLRGVRAASSL